MSFLQIELLKPPVGEGGTYEAFYKDLRPLLDWSPEQGWTVPNSEVAFKFLFAYIFFLSCGYSAITLFTY